MRRYRAKVRVQKSTPPFRLVWCSGIALMAMVAITASFTVKPIHAATQSFDTMMHRVISTETNLHNRIGYKERLISKLYEQANDAYDSSEIYLAYRLWHAAAEQGHADAAFKVGMLYDKGDGRPRDASRAAYWYILAAKHGHSYAQHNLGVAYANGDGVESNILTAMEWWSRAAEQGNVDSQYNLGIVYAMGVHGVKRNTAKAAEMWRRAALKGDPMAQYNLGALYANGEQGVRNVCEAMHWLEKSAASGVFQANMVLEAIRSEHRHKDCR